MEAVNTWDLHADTPAPGPDTGLRGQDFLVQGHIPDTLLSLLSLRTCHFLDTLEACKSATCCRGPTSPHGGTRVVCVAWTGSEGRPHGWHIPSGGAWLRHAWEPTWSLALGVSHRCPSHREVSDPSLSLIHNLWEALGDCVGVLSSPDTPMLGLPLLVPSLPVVTGTY